MSISISIALTHWASVAALIVGVLIGARLIGFRRRPPLLPPHRGHERLPPPAE